MISPEDKKLVNKLIALLQNQLELARHGHVALVEQVTEQLDPITQQIGNIGLLDLPEFNQCRQQIGRLYDDLRLILSTRRDEIANQMKHVRTGKKTLNTYKANIH